MLMLRSPLSMARVPRRRSSTGRTRVLVTHAAKASPRTQAMAVRIQESHCARCSSTRARAADSRVPAWMARVTELTPRDMSRRLSSSCARIASSTFASPAEDWV
jgi:hypothetical protein